MVALLLQKHGHHHCQTSAKAVAREGDAVLLLKVLLQALAEVLGDAEKTVVVGQAGLLLEVGRELLASGKPSAVDDNSLAPRDGRIDEHKARALVAAVHHRVREALGDHLGLHLANLAHGYRLEDVFEVQLDASRESAASLVGSSRCVRGLSHCPPLLDEGLERVRENAVADGVHPLLHLLCARGAEKIAVVVALLQALLRCSLQRLHALSLAARVQQLKAVLSLALRVAHHQILHWHNANCLGSLLLFLLEVVEYAVAEDEPALLPGLDPAALLGEPAHFDGDRVAENVHVACVHLDLVLLHPLVDCSEELLREVVTEASVAVVLDELLASHLVLDRGVVEVGVEHDEREGQHVGHVFVLEDARVVLVVPPGEALHDSVDLLRLARKAELGEESTECLVKVHLREVEVLDKARHDLRRLLVMLAQHLSELGLVEAGVVSVEKVHHFVERVHPLLLASLSLLLTSRSLRPPLLFGSPLHHALDEEFNALLRLLVEEHRSLLVELLPLRFLCIRLRPLFLEYLAEVRILRQLHDSEAVLVLHCCVRARRQEETKYILSAVLHRQHESSGVVLVSRVHVCVVR
mmetsp:Transcript_12581/g.50323  ORF Transcript_12581/g.50323 Transcript_12581/m.50323 type:complete len:581 (-) Transcript_12581:1208-2950(-)